MEHAERFADFCMRIKFLGYRYTYGDAFRSKEQAEWNAKKGIGSANSLHCDRLANDLNIFKAGKLLTKTEDLKEVGQLWESMGGTWGGRFSDGNHFSTAFMGRK
jgi:hypothetical protein